MLHIAYSIYDIKAKKYSLPFYTESEDVAKRIVAASAVEGSMLKMFPSDFILYDVGFFDDESADYFTDSDPVKVCTVNDLIGGDNLDV